MGWFARYGIPGTFLLLDSLLWIFLLVPEARFYAICSHLHKDYISVLGALLALSAVPFGYILTIIQQYSFLRRGKCFILPKIRRGIYRRALEKCGMDIPKSHNEAKIEATVFSKLYLSDEYRYLPRGWDENVKFVRTWVERRVDILVINRTLRLATALPTLTAISIALYWRFTNGRNLATAELVFLALSLLLYLFLWKSTIILEKQLVSILSRFYQKNNIFYHNSEA